MNLLQTKASERGSEKDEGPGSLGAKIQKKLPIHINPFVLLLLCVKVLTTVYWFLKPLKYTYSI